MSLFFADLVREASFAEGTGPLALGGAIAGHRRFADVVPAGARFHYAIAGVTHPHEWETGEGELDADGALLRTPLASSAGGAAVDFSAGLKAVALTVAAEWFAAQEQRNGGGTAESPVLAALAQLDATPGLVEQTGADAFAKRPTGTAAAGSVLTRGDGDGRYVAASGYTAADVLAKLLSVDGSGSGLDADLLDGLNAAAFAQLSGAAFTGAVSIGGPVSASGNASLRNLRVEGTGSGFSGTGVGVEMFQAGGTAYQSAYNRTSNGYAPFAIVGSSIALQISGVGVGSVTGTGLSINGQCNVSAEFRVGGTRVVGARAGGWAVPTGTASRTAFDTASASTAQLAERLKALIDDLSAHGLIGS